MQASRNGCAYRKASGYESFIQYNQSIFEKSIMRMYEEGKRILSINSFLNRLESSNAANVK